MDSSIQFLRLRDVCKRVGLGRAEVYRRIALGRFPGWVKLGPRASVWVASEVEAWQRAEIERARSGRPS